ncbi:MAG: sugar phosphate nucleotidyltransferase [Phycisphaerae bacterium]|nr:NDP-sugar synthase [Tepidisphaeraceae bacterium]
MKAVVLAGGQEFGQCPLSRQLPRALWPMVDRPVIESVLTALRGAGIGQMAISANGRTHTIASKLGYNPAPDITIHYSEDAMPRGAAGCIKDCESWLGPDDRFLVVQGTSLYLGVDWNHLIAEHVKAGAAVTVAATVDTTAAGDFDRQLQLQPAGIYVCEPSVFPFIKTKGYQDMKEQLIPKLTEKGLKVQAVPLTGKVLSVRNEEWYLNAMVALLNDPAARKPLVDHLPAKVPGLWIHPSAYVHPQARVIGPAYVGPGTKIMADAVVIGPAVIGENCEIGSDAVVHESILWNESRVGRGAMVEQAVVAAKAVVAPGVEVRGSIVLDTALSSAERTSLSGSTDLSPQELTGDRWWKRLWKGWRAKATVAE